MNLENNNNVQHIFQCLRNKHLAIDFNGKFLRILPLIDYKIRFIKLIGLIMLGFMAYIIKQIPYHPITIMGNTIYSQVVASCLSRYKIPYVLCRGFNRIPYYETDQGYEIPFEGPNSQFFSTNQDTQIPLIPNTKEELSKLELHTNLSNLEYIQYNLLTNFPSKNGVYIASMNDIIHKDREKAIKNPIINIRRFCGNLYYIITINEIWLSRIIISDIVHPLQPDEIISVLYGTIKEDHNENFHIKYGKNVCIVNEPTKNTILTRHSGYKINTDLTITTLIPNKLQSSIDNKCSIIGNDNIIQNNSHINTDYECILYSLENPRSFGRSIYIIHPFHFPVTWDPFLTIMIITLGILQDLLN